MHPDRARNIEDARRSKHQEVATPLPRIGSIHRARVSSIRDFGAFVELEPSRVQGLVHISELSNARVDKVSDIVDVGEMVWVKVIGIKDDRRLSFSMKYCDQGSGRDLDINEVKLTMARNGQKVKTIESGPISFGAVLDTNCSRCGVHGHTSKECYADMNGDRYDLIPDVLEERDLIPEKPSRKHKRDKDGQPKHEKKLKRHKEHNREKSSHRHEKDHKERSSQQASSFDPGHDKHEQAEKGDRLKKDHRREKHEKAAKGDRFNKDHRRDDRARRYHDQDVVNRNSERTHNDSDVVDRHDKHSDRVYEGKLQQHSGNASERILKTLHYPI